MTQLNKPLKIKTVRNGRINYVYNLMTNNFIGTITYSRGEYISTFDTWEKLSRHPHSSYEDALYTLINDYKEHLKESEKA